MRNHFFTGCVITALSLFIAGGPTLADNKIEFGDKGLDVTSSGGKLKMNLAGRLHIDAVTFDEDVTELDNDADIRRARLEFSLRFMKDFALRVDYDFSDVSRGWKNVWATWEFADGFEVQGGNFTAPFSLEDMMSSNNTVFMERSLGNAISPGFLLGGAINANGENWTASAGYFEEPIDDEEDRKETEGEGVTARFTFLPYREEETLIHLGLGVEARSLDDTSGFRLRTRPESALAQERLLDTGSLANVDQFTSLNVEAAWLSGPLSVQGQYQHMWLDRSTIIADPEFNGWYAQAAWVITGETRKYSKSSGVFGAVEPKDSMGAIEVAVRYSTLDLEDETVNGGEETNITAAVNWYVNNHLRLMANYINVDADPNDVGIDENIDIGQVRLQLAM